MLGATLVSHHNLTFMADLMARIRSAIQDGALLRLREEIAEHWDQ
jgi:tRNA-guanine family transglycosylase